MSTSGPQKSLTLLLLEKDLRAVRRASALPSRVHPQVPPRRRRPLRQALRRREVPIPVSLGSTGMSSLHHKSVSAGVRQKANVNVQHVPHRQSRSLRLCTHVCRPQPDRLRRSRGEVVINAVADVVVKNVLHPTCRSPIGGTYTTVAST